MDCSTALRVSVTGGGTGMLVATAGTLVATVVEGDGKAVVDCRRPVSVSVWRSSTDVNELTSTLGFAGLGAGACNFRD